MQVAWREKMGTFEECALQYRLIYVDRSKRYEEGVEAFLGQPPSS